MKLQSFNFLQGGGEMGELIARYNWAQTNLGSIEQWSPCLRAHLSMMLSSRFPMLIFWSEKLVTFYNDAFRPSLGDNGKHPSSLGQRGEESWAESWPVIGPMIYNIMAGGNAVWFEDQKLPIYREGKMDYAYWTYSFSPIINDDEKIAGILVTCAETTKAVESLQKLDESNIFSRSIFNNSPVAKAVYLGEKMIINMVNQNMLQLMGRNESVIGKPLLEAMPELKPLPIMERLLKVYNTGETYYQPEEKILLIKHGKPYTGYYNYTYKALCNAAGEIYGIVNTAVEITDQVLMRKKVEETELTLLAAIDLAELATWTIDAKTNNVTYSKRLQQWLGTEHGILLPEGSPNIADEDRERVRQAVIAAMQPGGNGEMDETYTIINLKNGQKRIIHVNGKTIFDNDGAPLTLSGTAQDVTMQQQLQLALENEVELRTEELASAVEELRATNEDMAEVNQQLIRSNEELAQYAYVASHDLQEPLRKIRTFSSRLSDAENLPVGVQQTVNKIQQSAERMSLLINDLLDFSRLLKSEELLAPVDLNEVLQNVKKDFELVIAEKEAQINIGSLPVIEAVRLQMNQLFYNLIGNALKFSKPNEKPVININARKASRQEIEENMDKPGAGNNYNLITVKDNGIGFMPEHTEQIFDLFKRLHARSEYAGSGIGLSICRRIVQNHHGKLFAHSKPGQGTTFFILLPLQ